MAEPVVRRVITGLQDVPTRISHNLLKALIDKPPTDGPTAAAPATKDFVRVINLSEDTREANLMICLALLARSVGFMLPLTQKNVAIDQKTGLSRGLGFVNFAKREDAEQAINKLNVYGYDSLILRFRWATPRAN
ncbi:Eukaryotic translation initiation factor 3 subunit G [Bienertia sinuspersici]